MSNEDNPTPVNTNALAMVGTNVNVSMEEMKAAGVADLRRKTNVAINRARKRGIELRKRHEEAKKELEADCKKATEKTDFGKELKKAQTALEKAFPDKDILYKVSFIDGSVNTDDNTFRVSVEIGLKSPYESREFSDSISDSRVVDLTEKGIELVEELKNLIQEMSEIRDELRELESFLDRGIQAMEDEFTSKLVRLKVGAMEDGDKVLGLANELFQSEDSEELIPASVLGAVRGDGPKALPSKKKASRKK